MSDFVSNVKTIPYSQEKVYLKLSDLRNLQSLKEKINSADASSINAIPGVDAGKMEQARQYLNNLEFDQDSISIGGTPVGNIKIQIVERDEPKCIKFEGQGTPIPLNLWIQILPVDADSSKVRVTLRAELNIFLKGMLQKPLQEAVERIADTLAIIPY